MNRTDTTDGIKCGCLNIDLHPTLQVSKWFTNLAPVAPQHQFWEWALCLVLTFIYQAVYSPRTTHSPAWQQGCGNSWWWINQGRHWDWFNARRWTLLIWFVLLPIQSSHFFSLWIFSPSFPRPPVIVLKFYAAHFSCLSTFYQHPQPHILSPIGLGIILSVFLFLCFLSIICPIFLPPRKQLINLSLPGANHLSLSISTPHSCSSACWSLFTFSVSFLYSLIPRLCLSLRRLSVEYKLKRERGAVW